MSEHAIEIATANDAPKIGRLLHDFNREFNEPTPDPPEIAERVRELMAAGDTMVLVPRPELDGLAVLRFRPSLWTKTLECYLAELYVIPARRGAGLGRALMDAAIRTARERGADYMELNTGEQDVAARSLYESLGFTNREQGPDGPLMYYYEREL